MYLLHQVSHHGHSHAHSHIHSAPKNISSVAWMVICGDGIHNLADGFVYFTFVLPDPTLLPPSDLPLAQLLLLATCLAYPPVWRSSAMSFPMRSETLPCSSRPGWQSSKPYSTTSSPPSWPWLAWSLASWSPPPSRKSPRGSSQPQRGSSSMWRWWIWCQSCPQDMRTPYLETVRGSQEAWHFSSR